MIRFGILSTASIIDRYIAGIRASKHGYVQAIASRTVEKAKEAAERLNIDTYYGTYEELYNDANVDVIYIPTVNGFHYRDAKNALMHHKHVVVEKPFVLKPEQAKELFEVAKENNCFLMEAQKILFLPATLKVKEMIENNIIGDIHYIELKAGFPSRFNYDHWMYDLSMGGGSFYGSATYTIEYMQFLFNNPKMSINGSYLPSPTGSDEVSNFQLNLNNKILVNSTITMNVALQNGAVFYGDKGYIFVDHFWKSRRVELFLNDGTHEVYPFPVEHEFVYEVDHINECILNQQLTSSIMTPERTIETVELVDRLYRQWGLVK